MDQHIYTVFAIGFITGGIGILVILASIGAFMRKSGGNQKVGVSETVSIKATPGGSSGPYEPTFDEGMGVEPGGPTFDD